MNIGAIENELMMIKLPNHLGFGTALPDTA